MYIFKIYFSRNQSLTEEVLNIKHFALYLINNQNSKTVFKYLWSVLKISDLSKQYVKIDSNFKLKYIVSLWSSCQNLIERLEGTQYHVISDSISSLLRNWWDVLHCIKNFRLTIMITTRNDITLNTFFYFDHKELNS